LVIEYLVFSGYKEAGLIFIFFGFLIIFWGSWGRQILFLDASLGLKIVSYYNEVFLNSGSRMIIGLGPHPVANQIFLIVY